MKNTNAAEVKLLDDGILSGSESEGFYFSGRVDELIELVAKMMRKENEQSEKISVLERQIAQNKTN